MTAIGMSAADMQSRAASFVSVRVSQISVTGGSKFSDSFAKRLETARSNEDVRSVSVIKSQKTEYSKEQPKAAEVSEKGETANQVEKINTAKAGEKVEAKAENLSPEETKSASNTEKTEGISEEEVVKALEILNSLMQGIANILEVSLRELQGSFEELNLEPADLFDTSKLTQLVLSVENTEDISQMLTDSDMLESFNEIKELVGNVLQDMSMEAERFKEITENGQFNEQLEIAEDETGEVLVLNEVGKEKPDANKTSVKNEEAKDFTVEVNKFETASKEVETFGTENSRDNGFGTGKSDDRKSGTEYKLKTSELTAGENFVAGLEKAIASDTVELPTGEQISVRDIVFQLTEAVKVNIDSEHTSLEMNLNPESLGRVNLNITSKNGVMTAQITTENEVSKEALESQLQILKENIEAQGVRVEAIEVTVSSYTFADSKNAQGESREHPENNSDKVRGSRSFVTDAETADTEEESLTQEIMRQSGSTVMYRA